MKLYYFNEIVTLLNEVKEFSISKIQLQNGKIIYINSKLLKNRPYTVGVNILKI